MTRLSSSIALVLAISATLTACQNDAGSPEPIMAPTFGPSLSEAVAINDEAKLSDLRRVTAKFSDPAGQFLDSHLKVVTRR